VSMNGKEIFFLMKINKDDFKIHVCRVKISNQSTRSLAVCLNCCGQRMLLDLHNTLQGCTWIYLIGVHAVPRRCRKKFLPSTFAHWAHTRFFLTRHRHRQQYCPAALPSSTAKSHATCHTCCTASLHCPLQVPYKALAKHSRTLGTHSTFSDPGTGTGSSTAQ
jgi:hypothetical protein